MRHARILVKRDTNTQHNLTLALWEIPIVEYLFDEGNVTVTEEFVKADQDYPDPAKEMVRLMKAYGSDVKTNIPYAVTVYGASRAGVRALAKAIEAAKEEDDEAARPRVRNRRRPHAGDALLA